MADLENLNVGIKSITLVSNQPTVTTQTLSGRTQVRSFGGQFYSGTITFPALNRADTRKVYGFLLSKRGSLTQFTIAPHPFTQVTGSQSASEGLASGASVGARSVTTTGSNEFAAGDLIKFSNHTKAYMVTSVSGQTLNIEPGLISAVTTGHTVESGTNFFMTVRIDGDANSFEMNEASISNIKFNFYEVV